VKYLLAGLGNIGDEYTNTRHNVGFMLADALAVEGKAQFAIDRYASVARIKFKGRMIVLIKPSTYMNLSGKAVRYWLEKEQIPIENLLVAYDDKDLPLGALRLRGQGSGGSHNGLNHVIELLNTSNFARLRIGIGNDFGRGQQIDFVLGNWTPEEEKVLLPRIKTGVDIVKSFSTMGLAQTMNFYNNK
jgi:PTH1 family peptidyl-tRNA hydrolase